MSKKKWTKTLLLSAFFSALIFGLISCERNTDEEKIPTHETYSLIEDQTKWEDVNYTYAQANGDNPLSLVSYDKGTLTHPALSKEVTLNATNYKKLVVSIKGDYFVQLNIHSVKEVASESQVTSFVFNLTSDYRYYEIDLDLLNDTLNKAQITRFEWVVTPGANRHFGTFSLNQFEFDRRALTVENYSNLAVDYIKNTYDGVSDTFDVNLNWYDTGYGYSSISEETQLIEYSILPGINSFLRTQVEGTLSNFNYINFEIRGEENTKISFFIETTSKEATEILPSYELVLDGTIQQATIYLEELSIKTKDALSQVRIQVEKDTIVPVNGSFEVLQAYFSNTALTDKLIVEVNTYLGGQNTFDFNHYWQTSNSLIATIDSNDEVTTVNYTKQFQTSSVYTALNGKFSDFSYINVRIQANPNEAFLLQFDTNWSYRLDHHMIADENGLIEVSMAFGLHFFPHDLDAIDGFRITPNVNLSQVSSEFVIEVAEFSKTPLVTYEVASSIEMNEFKQIGDLFTINEADELISWEAQEGFNQLTARVFGPFVLNNQLSYRYIDFTAVVLEERVIEFEVDSAKYRLTLNPTVTQYRIDLLSPTSGAADLWKFSGGFNLIMHIDTTTEGQMTLSSLSFSNSTELPKDIIDFNLDLKSFNGMTATTELSQTGIEVSYQKTKFNSLVYYEITPSIKNGKIASDYRYINLSIESADTEEFLIELSGIGNLTHYVTLVDGRIDLTIVLSPLALPNQINNLQFINITPMPNQNAANGTFSISEAHFSNESLVDYTPQTQIEIDSFKEIGSTFTIDSHLVSWQQGTGYKSLMVRMNGSYATASGLLLPYIKFEATVSLETIIEFNIYGTRYQVNLLPNTTDYVVDLNTPTFGNRDLWKFESGFNLLLTFDTSVSGSVEFGVMELTSEV